MSEYLHVEKPFLDQLEALGWEVIDQGPGTAHRCTEGRNYQLMHIMTMRTPAHSMEPAEA